MKTNDVTSSLRDLLIDLKKISSEFTKNEEVIKTNQDEISAQEKKFEQETETICTLNSERESILSENEYIREKVFLKEEEIQKIRQCITSNTRAIETLGEECVVNQDYHNENEVLVNTLNTLLSEVDTLNKQMREVESLSIKIVQCEQEQIKITETIQSLAAENERLDGINRLITGSKRKDIVEEITDIIKGSEKAEERKNYRLVIEHLFYTIHISEFTKTITGEKYYLLCLCPDLDILELLLHNLIKTNQIDKGKKTQVFQELLITYAERKNERVIDYLLKFYHEHGKDIINLNQKHDSYYRLLYRHFNGMDYRYTFKDSLSYIACSSTREVVIKLLSYGAKIDRKTLKNLEYTKGYHKNIKIDDKMKGLLDTAIILDSAIDHLVSYLESENSVPANRHNAIILVNQALMLDPDFVMAFLKQQVMFSLDQSLHETQDTTDYRVLLECIKICAHAGIEGDNKVSFREDILLPLRNYVSHDSAIALFKSDEEKEAFFKDSYISGIEQGASYLETIKQIQPEKQITVQEIPVAGSRIKMLSHQGASSMLHSLMLFGLTNRASTSSASNESQKDTHPGFHQ